MLNQDELGFNASDEMDNEYDYELDGDSSLTQISENESVLKYGNDLEL